MKNKMGDSEKLVERKLREHIKQLGGLCLKLPCDFCIGLPDRLCLLPGGKLAFVELKTTGKKPRLIQELMHDKIRSLGFRVEVIDRVSCIQEIFNDLNNE